jgi:sulfur carrier protein
MELTINGEKKTIEKADTLEDVMASLGFSPETRGVAAALNGAVVPRSQWKSTRIRSGDAIEVIHAVQGG